MATNSNVKTRDLLGSVLKIGLAMYTAFRTIDLVMSTLPPDQKIFGIFAVCGLDAALLHWDHYAADPLLAKNREQRTIGFIGIVGNLIGIFLVMVADSARFVAPGQFNDLIVTASVLGLAGFMVFNLSLHVIKAQFDPDRALAEEMAQHSRAEQLAKSKHENELARQRAAHARAQEKVHLDSDLELDELQHRQQVSAIKEDYMRAQIKTKPASGDVAPAPLDLVAQLTEALEALRTAQAKSPNGHSADLKALAADGAEAPKVVKTK